MYLKLVLQQTNKRKKHMSKQTKMQHTTDENIKEKTANAMHCNVFD